MLPHHESAHKYGDSLKTPASRWGTPINKLRRVHSNAPVFIARVLKNKLTSWVRQCAQKALYRFVESFIHKLIDKGLFL